MPPAFLAAAKGAKGLLREAAISSGVGSAAWVFHVIFTVEGSTIVARLLQASSTKPVFHAGVISLLSQKTRCEGGGRGEGCRVRCEGRGAR